jgi:tRNA A-37 threonylcarbamoyl transferase component Bud32
MAGNPPSEQPSASPSPSPAAGCPGHDELVEFARGRLAPQRVDEVAEHLKRCPACEAALAAARGDADSLLEGPSPGPTRAYRTAASPSDAPTKSAPPGPPSPGAADVGPPARLGPYELRRPIKAGGMGVVYEAWHTKLRRRVALKMLRPDGMHDRRMVARFHREMAAVGRLDHPNIVRATDADEAEGRHFLVMDFVDGPDLGELVRRHGPLRVPDACEIIRQAAVSLQYVHEHGMVHRDVKPSNLMLAPGGEVKLLDLGLALLYEDLVTGDEATEAGMRMGTVDYMAPEQAADAHHVDIRADLYSLGCTLYHLLTGRRPFRRSGSDTGGKQDRASSGAVPPAVRDDRPEAPAGLAAVLDRLVDRDPAKRYAVPAEAARALEPFAAGCDLPALLAAAHPAGDVRPAESAGTASASPARAPDRRVRAGAGRTARRALLAAGAVLLVVLAVVGAVLFGPRPEGPPPPTTTGPSLPPPPRPPEVVWPADYPRVLRDRPWQQPVALLEPRPDQPPEADLSDARYRTMPPEPPGLRLYQPLWCRRLAGTGKYFASTTELQLWYRTDHRPGRCTVLALDDDLLRRWFEFTADLPARRVNEADQPRGVFFGWRQEGPDRARAYFVRLDLRPAPEEGRPHGRLVVGPAVLDPRPQAAEQVTIDPLPDFQGTPPRTQALTAPAPVYRVRVVATPGKVRVDVNNDSPLEFEPAFDPRGPLGLWVQDGNGRFRTARVTALQVP